MNEFSAPLSRNEAILQNILGANNALEPAHSRVEAILLSILNDTPYTDPPLSRIEALLLAIKNKTAYTGAVVSRNEKILYAKLTGGEYPDPPLSRIEELLIEWLNASSGEETTVSGVPPITLAKALSAALVSLTQYGLCDQSSTPTPSAPQDIVCNNGVLKMVDDELPLGYKRLTGIRFDGDIHYETGESLTGDDDVTMTLDNTASQGQNVFGSYNGTSSGTKNFSLFIYGNGSASGSYFRYGEQLLRPRFGSGERTITFGKSGTDGFLSDASATPDTFTTPANAYIGMLPNSTSPAYTGDIVGNILVGIRLKWIPCERESDNAIGYYEAVNGKFLAPVGTGTPTSLGYDYSNAHLEVVGTPEVLSVTATGATTQTASVPDLFAVGDYADRAELISGVRNRKIGIKVMTGSETPISGNNGWIFEDAITDNLNATYSPLCTHFRGTSVTPQIGYVRVYYTSGGTPRTYFGMDKTVYDTPEKAKEFLAAQYAAGTPVIVLYPLAEPTTESVTPQSLSTVAGTNVISITAEVSPIELEVEYYKEAEA